MKRSEKVKKLATPISWIGGGIFTSEELNKIASNILNICEENGMLPPIKPDRTEADPGLGVPEWEKE